MNRDLLMARVDTLSAVPCWLWTGPKAGKGYGMTTFGGGMKVYVHRLSFELHKGPIPAGLEIDHLCFERLCVNPDHLEAVTHAENVARAIRRRTHCPQGHSYEGAYVDTTNTRHCRICDRDRHRVAAAKKRGLL